MPQDPNATVNADDHQDSPQSAHDQGLSNFADGSGPIFSMYLEMATEEDKRMAENWKADAEGILFFTGLFSAAVAALITVSIQDIRQNPQDTSNFYLANIYKATISPNLSDISSTLPTSPPPFSPPNHAVWVNALWFLSLVISLTCALLATFLQQWARRYLQVTHSISSPDKRARIRAFFAEGVEKCLLPWAVEILPTLLHVSLFLFFAGLVVFLCNVNITIFKLVLSWVGICTALYGLITLMPIIRHDSPYYTPLSSLAWRSVNGVAYIVSAVSGLLLYWTVCYRDRAKWLSDYAERCSEWFSQGMQRSVEETALESPLSIVNRAFMWTLYGLDEDDGLERFFSGLPGFCNSKRVDDPLPRLGQGDRLIFCSILLNLLHRTLSSDSLPAPIKNRRAMVCMKAIDPAYTPYSYVDTFSRHQCSGLLATGIVEILRAWRNHRHERTRFEVQAAISIIVARVQPRDDPWFILASNELGVPKAVLQNYATQGDSLSLFILIHLVQQQFSHIGHTNWPEYSFSKVLEEASKFDVKNTSLELQHDFCALWDQILHKARKENNLTMAFETLAPTRSVYIALHQDTDSAPTQSSPSTPGWVAYLWHLPSYPACNNRSHHPNSTPLIHGDSASTTIARTAHDNDSIAVIPSLPSRRTDTTSTSAHAPPRVNESLTDAQPLDDNTSSPVQTTPASRPIPSTSPNPVTAPAIHGSIDASPKTTQLSILDPLASPPPSKPKASASPRDVIAAEHTAVTHTTSDDLNVPSSASRAPVLPTAPTAQGPSRLSPSSAPDLGSTAQGADSTLATLRAEKEQVVPEPSSAITEDITVTVDVPPQSPPPQPIVGVAIAGLSRSSLDAEHAGEHPLSAHGQYDTV